MKPTIEQVYPDKDTNEHLIKMFQLIDYRRQNPLKWYRTEYRTDEYVYNELHHIIPRAYCKYHNYDLDNSDEGTIRLRYAEHVLIHVYLKRYFLEKKDYDVAYANAKTIQYMCGKNKDYISKVNGINTEEQKQILDLLQSNREDYAKASKHQMNSMSSEKLQTKSINQSKRMHEFWNNMSDDERHQYVSKIKDGINSRSQDEKDLQYKNVAKTRSNWSDEMKQQVALNTSKTSSKTWNSYSAEEYEQRKKNISAGTKKAMEKLDKEKWKQSRIQAAKTLSRTCQNRTQAEKEQITKNYQKFHIGSKAMSNDTTHHWRYVATVDQQKYLDMGYVFGNHSKEWILQGLQKIGPGRFG